MVEDPVERPDEAVEEETDLAANGLLLHSLVGDDVRRAKAPVQLALADEVGRIATLPQVLVNGVPKHVIMREVTAVFVHTSTAAFVLHASRDSLNVLSRLKGVALLVPVVRVARKKGTLLHSGETRLV